MKRKLYVSLENGYLKRQVNESPHGSNAQCYSYTMGMDNNNNNRRNMMETANITAGIFIVPTTADFEATLKKHKDCIDFSKIRRGKSDEYWKSDEYFRDQIAHREATRIGKW